VNLRRFNAFTNSQLKISRWLRCQSDNRSQQPDINSGFIARCLLCQVPLNKSSLLELDGELRKPEIKSSFERHITSKALSPTVSDSTILSFAEEAHQKPQQYFASCLQQVLNNRGYFNFTLPSNKAVKPAIIDGSCFGNTWASVFAHVGDQGTFPIDLEGYTTRGKETVASRQVMERHSHMASHILYDGLGFKKWFFKKALDHQAHGMVKTTDDTRRPIRWANKLFDSITNERELQTSNVEIVEITDIDRRIKDTIYRTSEVPWNRLDTKLNVARVHRTFLSSHPTRSDETVVFWLITTDNSLNAKDLRALGFARWSIENNVFKELNRRVNTKSKYVQSARKKQTLLFWWLMGWSLLQAYWIYISIDQKLAASPLKVTNHNKMILLQIGFGEGINDPPDAY